MLGVFLHVLSLLVEAPCAPGWEENSSMTSFIPWGPNSYNGSERRTFAVFPSLTPKGLPRGLPLKNSSGRGLITNFPTSSSLTPPGLFLPLVVLSDSESISVGRGVSLITVGIPFRAASGHFVSSECWGITAEYGRHSAVKSGKPHKSLVLIF